MIPTDQLSEDHRTIESVLNILERMCELLDEGVKVDPAHFEQVLEFIKVFADKSHHGKEEALLFPALEELGFSKDQGPLSVMLMDHAAGRRHVQELTAAVERYRTTKESSGIPKPARNYIFLLRDHIEKEDLVLFPMAAARLSEARQKAMLVEFNRLVEVILGDGKGEEFQEMIKKLKKLYESQ